MSTPLNGREILIELNTLGQNLRAIAVDAASTIEVSITMPAHTAQADVRRAVLRKLEWRLRKDGILSEKTAKTAAPTTTKKSGKYV